MKTGNKRKRVVSAAGFGIFALAFALIIWVSPAVLAEDVEPQVERPEGWTEETHGKDADPNYDTVFPQDKVNRIDIIIEPADWQFMIDEMTQRFGEFGKNTQPVNPNPPTQPIQPVGENIPVQPGAGTIPVGENIPVQQPDGAVNPPIGFETDPTYRPCTVIFENKKWYHAGIRFKGNSTLKDAWNKGIWKLPLRFDFDEFEDQYTEIDDQRFFGFKELSMGNAREKSMIREKTASDIFREAGVPCSMTAFYRVYIDHGEGLTYFGLYTMVEIPDDPMLDEQFEKDGGNLYKPEGSGANFVTFNQQSFTKKTNEDLADWSDIQAMFTALHANRQDAAQWREGLEAVFEVERFLRWLAVNTVIQNWDTYGKMAHNYYLYGDPGDNGRIHWIPWDNNEALSNQRGALSLDLTASEVGNNWPLIRYLIDDSKYKAMYIAFVHEIISGVFSVDYTRARYQKAHDLIKPYVTGDQGEQPGYTFLSNPNEFETELQYLFQHVEQRKQAVAEFLSRADFSPSPIYLNEIYYHPIAGPNDADDYEFVEIFNSSSTTTDLSGYALAGGTEFTFPQGSTFSARSYIVIARNAETYANLNCQIFQWDGGKLANEGETIRLKNADGVQIDFVKFDDKYPWSQDADGNGASLELSSRAAGNNALAGNWRASDIDGGTPGQANVSLLAADFGSEGLYVYNGTTWKRIADNPEQMENWGKYLALDYGDKGLFLYDGKIWTRISDNPENVKSWGSLLIADFGDYGIYAYDGETWSWIGPNPENIEVWGNVLAADFGDYGIYAYDGETWSWIGPNPENMETWGKLLAADFGNYGIYAYDGATWSWIGPNPENMKSWENQLAADFGDYGIYAYDGKTWSWIGPNPEGMESWGTRLVGDFGDYGIYAYDGKNWTWIGKNPENMTVVSGSFL